MGTPDFLCSQSKLQLTPTFGTLPDSLKFPALYLIASKPLGQALHSTLPRNSYMEYPVLVALATLDPPK